MKDSRSPFEGANVHIDKYFQNVETYNEYHDSQSNPYDFKKMREIIDTMIMPFITCQKHNFSLMKGLMHNHYVANGDFKGALILLHQIYPEGLPYEPDMKEISNLNTLSMSKEIEDWDENDQPVGKRFSEYETIANLTINNLPKFLF